MLECDHLIQIFNQCFAKDYRTKLARGEEEPLYVPAKTPDDYHVVYFAHGFLSSALHECAHWFIAGSARRLLPDYGYWYQPDGRTASQQALFQHVEIKPQALEWILSEICGHRFVFSFDNLNGDLADTQAFKQAVCDQVAVYKSKGLPLRAARFANALQAAVVTFTFC